MWHSVVTGSHYAVRVPENTELLKKIVDVGGALAAVGQHDQNRAARVDKVFEGFELNRKKGRWDTHAFNYEIWFYC